MAGGVEGYGRFARGLDHASNRTAISVRIDPQFGLSRRAGGQTAGVPATISVVYLDRGGGRWALSLDGRAVAIVTKRNSGTWRAAEANVTLGGSQQGSLLSLHSLDAQDDIFSLMEVLLED